MERDCDVCEDTYIVDERNYNRGWARCCSKSCAATKREKNRRTGGANPNAILVVESNLKKFKLEQKLDIQIWAL